MTDFLDTFKRHESSSEESGAEDDYEGDFAKGKLILLKNILKQF